MEQSIGDRWAIVRTRSSSGHLAYDYHPQVMYEAGTWKMWWCGYDPAGMGGDHILYAEATDSEHAAQKWHAHGSTIVGSFDDTLGPRGLQDNTFFDARDTCDPSVIRVGPTYYLYYGGTPLHGAGGYVPPGHGNPGNVGTYIGFATSTDGRHWTRGNQGNPIVEARDIFTPSYGAGLPTVTYKTDSDGHSRFYMSYFDTSTLPQPHHGYVNIRSTDPGFVTGREDLVAGAAGGSSRQWVAHTATTMASALGVGSWQYNDALDVWIEARANQVTFYPGDLASMEPSFPALDLSSLDFTAFHHRDHDSLARDPLGHSLPSTAIGDDRCGTVPLYHFSGAVPATPQGSACTIDAQCSVSDGAGHACDLQTHHCFDNNIYRADLIESSTTLRLSPATH